MTDFRSSGYTIFNFFLIGISFQGEVYSVELLKPPPHRRGKKKSQSAPLSALARVLGD